MSKCDCFDRNLERIKEKVIAQLPDDVTDLHVDWDGYVFILSGDLVPVNPKINIEYRKMKKDKTPAKNTTKDSVLMFCSYCPFCGRKLEGK
jgi:hypothetical protein